jgi:hypothetical protein
MIPGVALMIKGSHNEHMTSFILFIGIVLAVGFLSLRYGVDSRSDQRQL